MRARHIVIAVAVASIVFALTLRQPHHGHILPVTAQPARTLARATPPVPTTDAFAVPVLMYHRIDDLTSEQARSPLMRDLTVPTGDFEQQVKYLADNGFTFLLASQVETALREHRPLPQRAVAITMDDGYKDNFEKAFPILQKYHACATIFMVTNNFNKPERLSWPEVLTMRNGGVGYGSHTVTHADLTTLAGTRLDYELIESKRVLEQGLQQPVTSIAYPSGAYNDVVVERTKAAGYLAGWKKGGGPVQPGAEPYMLPRVRVRGTTDLAYFRKRVWSGYWTMRSNAAKQLIAERRRLGRQSA
jgi:peptidoglycan/xylan/chitin deacetylase (PgdA/CDA1 family)